MSEKKVFEYTLRVAQSELSALMEKKEEINKAKDVADALKIENDSAIRHAFLTTMSAITLGKTITQNALIESSKPLDTGDDLKKLTYRVSRTYDGIKNDLDVVPLDYFNQCVKTLEGKIEFIKNLLEENLNIFYKNEDILKDADKNDKRLNDARRQLLKILNKEVYLRDRIDVLEYVIENNIHDNSSIVEKIMEITPYIEDKPPETVEKYKKSFVSFFNENKDEIPQFVMEYVNTWVKEK